MRRKVYDCEGNANFLTFSCYRRRHLLGDDRAKRLVLSNFVAQLNRSSGQCIGFVVMPNHVHAIVWHSSSGQLSDFMKQGKRVSSYQIARLATNPNSPNSQPATVPIWQARYYEFNLYSSQKMEEKLEYMHQNPVRAGLVKQASDWPWSSARYYERREDVGVTIRWVNA